MRHTFLVVTVRMVKIGVQCTLTKVIAKLKVSDKKLFTLATLKNSQNARLQASGATNSNGVGAKRCICGHVM